MCTDGGAYRVTCFLSKTALPTYGGIRYQQLYAGIDLAYTSNNGQLKSTYTVAPGANPATIGWQ